MALRQIMLAKNIEAEQSDIRPDAKNNTEQADMDGKENGKRSSKK